MIDRIVELVAAIHGPIVELGAGGGALTRPLAGLGRPLMAIELDPRRADALRRALAEGAGLAGPVRDGASASDASPARDVGPAHRSGAGRRGRAMPREHAPPGPSKTSNAPRSARVITADALSWSFPETPHVIASNVPFHLTTAILRRLLAEPAWTDAILLTQWEVARRRCGVGGTSQLTVQWAPWFEFALDRRVPAAAFRPAPAVDGGLFMIRRRSESLVSDRERRAYQAYVASVFGGRGRGLAQVLSRAPHPLPNAKTWLTRRGIPADALPARLAPADWSALWRVVREHR